MTDTRRQIPRTDTLLDHPPIAEAVARLGRSLVKSAVNQAQERARSGAIAPEDVAADVLAKLPDTAADTRSVINATGVVVHTNLGRAPLSAAALRGIGTAVGATDVEFDLDSGTRARRGRGALTALSEAVPAAEAVHVVNNNAAALLLCALALAPGKEIVISRGELVEIGDGFRIPDLLASAGARLREVGATNRTSPADYAAAIGPDTGFVLKVHPSNFHVSGFTSEAPVPDLAALSEQAGVPLVVDTGSGLLAPHPRLPGEPDAHTMLTSGATLVTASGDKLLGGPQAGLLLGAQPTVEQLRRHPAARALRVDKLTLAALEATLRGPAPPVTQALDAEEPALLRRAEKLAAELGAEAFDAHAVASRATVGGGGAPGVDLPSAAISLPPHYARPLRLGPRPVIGRLEQGRCLLDLRAVAPDQDQELVTAVRRCM